MRTTVDQFDQEVDAGDERDQDQNGRGRGEYRGMGRQSYRERPPEETVVSAEPSPEPHDLTLGMTALAGIFLAVVLVCAVFFGFGYSTGRTLHGSKAAAAPVAAAAGSAAGPQASSGADDASAPTATPQLAATPPLAASQPLVAAQQAAKPSAGSPLGDAGAEAAPREQASAAQRQTAEEPGFPPAASVAATRPGLAGTAADVHASALPAAAAAAGGVMVQIAAVMRAADADMLAHALRTNGYAAIVRSEPQDKFLHVQVGPFATRDQAKAMRARLLGDGYNAFLKP